MEWAQSSPEAGTEQNGISSDEGSRNTFAKPSNVDTNSRILCCDIRDLGKRLLPVGMLVVLDSVCNRVIRNRPLGRSTRRLPDSTPMHSASTITATWQL